MRTASLLLAVLVLGACGAEPAPLPPWRGEGRYVEITVQELHCAGCEKTLEDAIALVEGVEAVTADHESKLVLVTLEADADRTAAIPGIRDAVHEGGMRVLGEAETGPGEDETDPDEDETGSGEDQQALGEDEIE